MDRKLLLAVLRQPVEQFYNKNLYYMSVHTKWIMAATLILMKSKLNYCDLWTMNFCLMIFKHSLLAMKDDKINKNYWQVELWMLARKKWFFYNICNNSFYGLAVENDSYIQSGPSFIFQILLKKQWHFWSNFLHLPTAELKTNSLSLYLSLSGA